MCALCVAKPGKFMKAVRTIECVVNHAVQNQLSLVISVNSSVCEGTLTVSNREEDSLQNPEAVLSA